MANNPDSDDNKKVPPLTPAQLETIKKMVGNPVEKAEAELARRTNLKDRDEDGPKNR